MVEKVKEAAEVDWQAYYASIKSVCPWSYKAYMQDRILVWDWAPTQANTVISIFNHSNYEALVFTFDTVDSKWLEQYCDNRNLTDERNEWLWSHPEHGGDSTPVPCLICQPRTRLEDLRNRTGYYDE